MISRFTVAEGLWPIKILYNHLILKILYIMTPGTEQVDIKWILGISALSKLAWQLDVKKRTIELG